MGRAEDRLVSVVVPVYNVEKYVEKCLLSLTGQSYKSIEIILVDDGSTDGSGAICEEIAKKDKRIKVFHKENSGLSGARNFGIKKASGEFVCLVDSDDFVKKDYVAELVGAVSDGVQIVVCGYDGNVPRAEVISGKEATLRLLLKQDNMEIVAWNKLYRLDLFNEIEYPEGQNYEDTLTTYKLLSKACLVSYVPESLYVYRERQESITKQDDKRKKLEAREKAAREAVRYFSKDSDLKAAAEIALLTAKLAWIDFSLLRKVKYEYGVMARKWICENAEKYENNKYMTRKLGVYVGMIKFGGGMFYKLFRMLRHE